MKPRSPRRSRRRVEAADRRLVEATSNHGPAPKVTLPMRLHAPSPPRPKKPPTVADHALRAAGLALAASAETEPATAWSAAKRLVARATFLHVATVRGCVTDAMRTEAASMPAGLLGAVAAAGDAPDVLGYVLESLVGYHARPTADGYAPEPNDDRRKSGSHYTPRDMADGVARRTLEPLLACLGEHRTAEQILSLRVADPSVGGGVFLLVTCVALAEEVVAVWRRAGVPERTDDDVRARRLVAERCLWGVDKNPEAAAVAKLALWLEVGDATMPLTFADRRIFTGDALVGLDLGQLASFHWQRGAPRVEAIAEPLRRTVTMHRRLAETDAALGFDGQTAALWEHVDVALADMRLIGDVCIGAFFAEAKPKAREAERRRRLGVVERWIAAERAGDPETAAPLRAELETLARPIRDQHRPFHWWLEIPQHDSPLAVVQHEARAA